MDTSYKPTSTNLNHPLNTDALLHKNHFPDDGCGASNSTLRLSITANLIILWIWVTVCQTAALLRSGTFSVWEPVRHASISELSAALVALPCSLLDLRNVSEIKLQ